MQLSSILCNMLFGAVVVQATWGGSGSGSSSDDCPDVSEYKRTWGKECSCEHEGSSGWRRAVEVGVAGVATSEKHKHKCCPPCASTTATTEWGYQPSSPPETATTSCTEGSPPSETTTQGTTGFPPPQQSTYVPQPSQSTNRPVPSQSSYTPPSYPTSGVVVPTTLTTSRAPTPTTRVSASGRPTTTSTPPVVTAGAKANAPAAGGMLFAAVMAAGAII